jgi:putative acetyltransferase
MASRSDRVKAAGCSGTPLPVDPASDAARRLVAMSDAYMSGLYPPESNHFDTPELLSRAGVHFIGIWSGTELIACGGTKLMDDDGRYGEIKRVYVLPAHRGHGHARELMAHLEEWLLSQACPLARLETGIRQPEALALYRSLGYRERGAFGAYLPDPLSVFMEKQLAS